VPIAEIAEAQAIPPRFLEQILPQLKQAGYVESRRGVQGGYTMTVPPEVLTVGDVIRFIDGPLDPVQCIAGKRGACPLQGSCAFIGLWDRARQAVEEVYDSASFRDLADQYEAACRQYVSNYTI